MSAPEWLNKPLKRNLDQWVMMKDAHTKIGRGRATVYRWVRDGKIRTMRPGKELWLHLPDLLATEANSVRKLGS